MPVLAITSMPARDVPPALQCVDVSVGGLALGERRERVVGVRGGRPGRDGRRRGFLSIEPRQPAMHAPQDASAVPGEEIHGRRLLAERTRLRHRRPYPGLCRSDAARTRDRHAFPPRLANASISLMFTAIGF